jgi:hypothetical protein
LNIVYYIDKALFSYSIPNKTKKKLLQQSNSISNLQLGSLMEFCFLQNETSLNLIRLRGHLFKSLISTRKRKGEKKRERQFFKYPAKELFQFIRDQETKEKWNKQKLMKINRTFLKHITESSFESLKMAPRELRHFRLVDAESKSEIMENFITKDGYNHP